MKLDHHESIEISCSPEQVWDLVSDVTRTGEWSAVCRACEWEDADGPAVGAHFIGHNRIPGREWSTRSTVLAADRGREFAWTVNDGWVVWRYTMDPIDGGTRLTEWWEFTEKGQAGFVERYGDQAPTQIEARRANAYQGIPDGLAAIKRIAEAGTA